MNREILVSLLRKNIQELDMITEGFMEMNEYPKAIISLAKLKTEDIQLYIQQLAELKPDFSVNQISSPELNECVSEPIEIETVEATISETVFEQSEAKEIEFVFTDEQSELTIDSPFDLQEVHIIDETAHVEELNVESVILPVDEKIILQTASRNDTMSKSDTSRSSMLGNKKIMDLKQGINIGDRFLFQRELFKGNGEDMNKTLNYINQLATLEEALQFLRSKYNWTPEEETVEAFYQIVRRRFI